MDWFGFSPVDSDIGPWNRSPAHVGGWNISIDNTHNRGNRWLEM